LHGEIPDYSLRLLAFVDLLGWEALTRKPNPVALDRISAGQ
jgi:hypothetical protein